LFAEAQRVVRWHYQWIVIEPFRVRDRWPWVIMWCDCGRRAG
jgi:hypothetical protein